jgi:hypothetical protein
MQTQLLATTQVLKLQDAAMSEANDLDRPALVRRRAGLSQPLEEREGRLEEIVPIIVILVILVLGTGEWR